MQQALFSTNLEVRTYLSLMASPLRCSQAPFSSTRARFDEQRWLSQVRSDLDGMAEAADAPSSAVAVAAVPRALLATKPEAYVPQLLALGPYHHWDAHLYETERHKLASVNRTQKQLRSCMNLQQLAESFAANDQKIRSYYHRHLDLDKVTLAWMMVIDASFLLEFLHNFGAARPEPAKNVHSFTELPSMSNMLDYSARTRLAYNSILRDVVMLQNQIPFFLIRKILCSLSSSEQAADEALTRMLIGFAKDISPFKFSCTTTTYASLIIDVKQQAHLLQLLYRFIAAEARETCKSSCGSCDASAYVVDVLARRAEDDEPPKLDSTSTKSTLFSSTWDSGAVFGKLIMLALKIPWAIVSKLSCVSLTFNSVMASLMSGGSGEVPDDQQDSADKSQHRDEMITIPSARELARAGVRFSATNGDLTTIGFDAKTATLYIPAVVMDANTEVVLRNLAAYETSVESGPMIVTRYTELISGIVAADEDVRLLRRAGIIANRMTSDQEAASVWIGMSNPARAPAKVECIDRVIADVNGYYNGRWRVKARKLARAYVCGPWQLLTLLAVLLLLFMTCVQSFCSVYNCDSHWTSKMANLEQGWSGPEV